MVRDGEDKLGLQATNFLKKDLLGLLSRLVNRDEVPSRATHIFCSLAGKHKTTSYKLIIL